jgi:hypothetical protein
VQVIERSKHGSSEHAEDDGSEDANVDADIRSNFVAATTQPFDFGYLDVAEHVAPRFREWLHEAWLSVLKQWEDAL